MTWFEALVLGVVQGLTEFLPISSSGHVLIASQIFGWSDPGAAFTAVMQIGTESAVIIYFRADIARIAAAWWRSIRSSEARGTADARIGWLVIVGSLPIGVLGVVFTRQIETVARNLWLVAIMLIVFGILLGIADRFGQRTRPIESLTWRNGIALGFAQAFALIPGVSRSGATITGGLLLGLTREAATRYAFLLAIPAVLASGLYEATKIGEGPAPEWGPTLVATAIAFVIGYAVIAWLLRYLRTGSYLPFVLYRIGLGAVVLALLGLGVLTTP